MFAIVHRPFHFSVLLTEAFVWQLNLACKKKNCLLINKIVYTQCRRIHQLGTHDRGHGWPSSCGNKITLVSRFGGWVWIVLNSYFSITEEERLSFYWYFLWECLWSKNSTKSVKHISDNFIQDFCLSEVWVQCCFTSTETIRTVRDGEPRTATSNSTQLLSSDLVEGSHFWLI